MSNSSLVPTAIPRPLPIWSSCWWTGSRLLRRGCINSSAIPATAAVRRRRIAPTSAAQTQESAGPVRQVRRTERAHRGDAQPVGYPRPNRGTPSRCRDTGTAGYPLPVPRRPELPAFDVRLCYHDSRRPSDVRLGVTKVAGYVMRRLARAGRPGSAGGSDVS